MKVRLQNRILTLTENGEERERSRKVYLDKLCALKQDLRTRKSQEIVILVMIFILSII